MISRAMEDIIMGYVLTLVPSFNIAPSLLKLQNSEWDGLLVVVNTFGAMGNKAREWIELVAKQITKRSLRSLVFEVSKLRGFLNSTVMASVADSILNVQRRLQLH